MNKIVRAYNDWRDEFEASRKMDWPTALRLERKVLVSNPLDELERREFHSMVMGFVEGAGIPEGSDS